jgi:hypothetical protein
VLRARLAFDHRVHAGVHFVMSGGGGKGLCSGFRGICAEGREIRRIEAASSTPCRSQ